MTRISLAFKPTEQQNKKRWREEKRKERERKS